MGTKYKNAAINTILFYVLVFHLVVIAALYFIKTCLRFGNWFRNAYLVNFKDTAL